MFGWKTIGKEVFVKGNGKPFDPCVRLSISVQISTFKL